jgi:hypothetical protein
MRLRLNRIAALASFALACLWGSVAIAQTIQVASVDIALRNGESTEFADVWWISADCKSLMTGTPDVEVMEGPPGVTVTVKQAPVVPRTYSCANPIPGGKLIIAAKGVEEYSRSTMVFRVTYKTRNGDRQRSHHVRVTLFP